MICSVDTSHTAAGMNTRFLPSTPTMMPTTMGLVPCGRAPAMDAPRPFEHDDVSEKEAVTEGQNVEAQKAAM